MWRREQPSVRAALSLLELGWTAKDLIALYFICSSIVRIIFFIMNSSCSEIGKVEIFYGLDI